MQHHFVSPKNVTAICFAFLVLFSSLSNVQAAKKGLPAVTTLAEVDTDFHYQGEYFGTITVHYFDRSIQHVEMGLQVIATGGGTFDAVLYPGGLPGAGWYTGPKFKMKAKRVGDVVDFRGEEYRVVVFGEYALIHAANGQPLGQLAKTVRSSSTMGAVAPGDAITLFNGYDTSKFKNGKMVDGTFEQYLAMGTELKETFKDYTLHVEFRLPYMPTASEQARGNSGVYLQSRYEVQILDSFGRDRRYNYCGSLYKQRAPDMNMCYPPLSWQTYDIVFKSPRFDSAGSKIQNARISVFHNGIAVHDNVDVTAKTGGGRQEGVELFPTRFQDHSNPVRFRNMWIVDHNRPSLAPYAPYASTY